MKSKRKLIIALSIIIFGNINLQGQDNLKYRRSSLNMVLIESDNFPNKETVVKTYKNHPFPAKYNEHSIADKKFDISKVTLSTKDMLDAGFYKDTLSGALKITIAKTAAEKIGSTIRYINEEKTLAVIEPMDLLLYPAKIEKFIKEKQLAKQVATTWFNRKNDGTLDEKLIIERGMYSASESDKDAASAGADDMQTLLFDIDLIGNTFIVFNKLTFIKNEPAARLIMEVAKAAIEAKEKPMNPTMKEMAFKAIDKAYDLGKVGYTVLARSWLYKLDWSKEIAEDFYFRYDKSNEDRLKNWENDTLLKLKYVGSETAQSLVTFSLTNKSRTQEEIIAVAVDRIIDNTFSKLQKEYVVFRPVTPVTSVEPLTARIGLKEGLEPGQKYEILEYAMGQNGFPALQRIGKVKVDKKTPIWDNRLGAELEKLLDANGIELPKKEFNPFTTFKGGKKAVPGMHFIRLLK
jgi:hypothetical protein